MLYLPALTFSPKLLLVLLRAALPKSIWALTGLFPCACGMEVPRAPMLPAEAPWFTPRFRLLALGGRLLYYVTRIRAIMRLIVKREKRRRRWWRTRSIKRLDWSRRRMWLKQTKLPIVHSYRQCFYWLTNPSLSSQFKAQPSFQSVYVSSPRPAVSDLPQVSAMWSLPLAPLCLDIPNLFSFQLLQARQN